MKILYNSMIWHILVRALTSELDVCHMYIVCILYVYSMYIVRTSGLVVKYNSA